MEIKQLKFLDKQAMIELSRLEGMVLKSFALNEDFMYRGYRIGINHEDNDYLYIDLERQPICYDYFDRFTTIKYIIDYIYERENH